MPDEPLLPPEEPATAALAHRPDEATPAVPRVAFWGLCPRATLITDGPPFLWHTNLLGLSSTIAAFVFPLNLRSHNMVAAIYGPQQGEVFSFVFRGDNGQKDVELKWTVSALSSFGPDGETKGVDGPVGWVPVTQMLDTDLWFNEPGQYAVYVDHGSVVHLIGHVNLVPV